MMGGYGSTRWGKHRRRKIVENYLWLSISDLRTLFGKGVLEWPDMQGVIGWEDYPNAKVDYDIRHIAGGLALCLNYNVTVDLENYVKNPVIAISDTPCAYGGKRWWLHCPFCTKRVAYLYLVGTEFACRRCHNLTYKSVQDPTVIDRKILNEPMWKWFHEMKPVKPPIPVRNVSRRIPNT